MNKWKHLMKFFQTDVWENRIEKKSSKNFIYQWLVIFMYSIKGFIEDKAFEKASTLTFYSLLSIVPLVAIGFGIAKELGFQEKFAEQVKSQFHSQPQIAEKIIEFSNSTLKTTKGGLIAGFGVGILFWTVLSTIGSIETFFDEIWKVKTERTLWQQVKSYLPMILLFPIFLVGSNSIIIYVSTKALLASQSLSILNIFSSSIKFLFELTPHLLSWGLLSFLYIYLPNTPVNWKAGILAGVITGILYFSWQWIYVTFQANASSYGVIYGSFAAIPLFLIWLNYSWLLIIFGAELSYHIQQKLYSDKTDR
jgi:membrane protein